MEFISLKIRAPSNPEQEIVAEWAALLVACKEKREGWQEGITCGALIMRDLNWTPAEMAEEIGKTPSLQKQEASERRREAVLALAGTPLPYRDFDAFLSSVQKELSEQAQNGLPSKGPDSLSDPAFHLLAERARHLPHRSSEETWSLEAWIKGTWPRPAARQVDISRGGIAD